MAGYYNWANRQLETLIGQDPTYQRSKFPGMRYGFAQQVMNSRMPGSDQFQKNLFSSQGNVLDSVNRGATDSSQALAAATASQGQTNEDLSNLQTKQMEWSKFGLNNLNEAYGAMADEDRMVEQDKIRKYGDLVQLRGAQAANKLAKRKALWNTVGGIANLGVAAFTGGASSAASGIANMFKGK